MLVGIPSYIFVARPTLILLELELDMYVSPDAT